VESRGANSAYGTVKRWLGLEFCLQTVRQQRPKGRYSEKTSNPASDDKLEGLAGKAMAVQS